MARFTQESISRVREAVDIIELVGKRTDVRRVGTRFVGLCPFHDERTPSFSVDPSKGLYHCFGCSVGGDAIEFVQETEALDFAAAVEMLAERYNVELEREQENPEQERHRRHRERVLELLNRTTDYFAKYLWDSDEAADARSYLTGRGLGEEILREFRVGYAPKGWDRLLSGAQRDGFSVGELNAAGLLSKKRSGAPIDRFRERIMFPLADARGRVLGFGARRMRDDDGAKYINTRDSLVYHKGRQLFGIDRARASAAKTGRLIVVEGYTDVLALHQAGVEDSVAIMGTAMTEQQMTELARTTGGDGVVYLALDPDVPGRKAMLRASKIAEDKGVELRVVRLPDGVDPAELVGREGGEAFEKRLEEALSVVEFAIEFVFAESDLGSPDGRDRAMARMGPLIAGVPAQSARRDYLVTLVADRLDLPVEYVVHAVEQGPGRVAEPLEGGDPGPEPSQRRSRGPVAGAGTPASSAHEAERVFLGLCLAGGRAGRDLLGELLPEHFSSDALWDVREHLVEHFDDPLTGLDDAEREVAMLVAGVALQAEQGSPTPQSTLRMGFLHLDLRRIDRQIRLARHTGDLGRQAELAGARQNVRREMDAVMGEAI